MYIYERSSNLATHLGVGFVSHLERQKTRSRTRDSLTRDNPGLDVSKDNRAYTSSSLTPSSPTSIPTTPLPPPTLSALRL